MKHALYQLFSKMHRGGLSCELKSTTVLVSLSSLLFFSHVRDATHRVNAVSSTAKYVARDTVSLLTAVFRLGKQNINIPL